MAWLVTGQVAGHLIYHTSHDPGSTIYHLRSGNPIAVDVSVLVVSLIYGIPAIVGLVVVSQMMLQDEVCRVI